MDRHPERQYLDLLLELCNTGFIRPDRTGVGTQAVFGRQMRFDLGSGFPLLTTKRLHWKSIITELLWMLTGETNNRWLNDRGVTIWDEWADQNGDLGPVYGKQWRSWGAFPRQLDQIQGVIDSLRDDPYGRRHIVSAWNPSEIPLMALPPCHCIFQFFVDNRGRLSCQLYQRSADAFLGLPFNIASYAALTMMIAREVGREPGEFVHSLGDVHLYANHIDQAKRQIVREPLSFPVLTIRPGPDIFNLKPDDFRLDGYENAHPHIAANVAR